jgi:hypothetical protein
MVLAELMNACSVADLGLSRATLVARDLSEKQLARLWDQSYSKIELIADVIDHLLEQRSPGPGVPVRTFAFDQDTLATIAEVGFTATLERTKDDEARARLARLYKAMLSDETLILDAQGAILCADEISPYWEKRIFSPSVLICDVNRGMRLGLLRHQADEPPAEFRFELEGDTLTATIDWLSEYAGHAAAYVIRFVDDPEMTRFSAPTNGSQSPPDGKASDWRDYFARATRSKSHAGDGVVDAEGTLVCTIGNRPRCGELKDSVLVVGLLGRTDVR